MPRKEKTLQEMLDDENVMADALPSLPANTRAVSIPTRIYEEAPLDDELLPGAPEPRRVTDYQPAADESSWQADDMLPGAPPRMSDAEARKIIDRREALAKSREFSVGRGTIEPQPSFGLGQGTIEQLPSFEIGQGTVEPRSFWRTVQTRDGRNVRVPTFEKPKKGFIDEVLDSLRD